MRRSGQQEQPRHTEGDPYRQHHNAAGQSVVVEGVPHDHHEDRRQRNSDRTEDADREHGGFRDGPAVSITRPHPQSRTALEKPFTERSQTARGSLCLTHEA